MTDKEQKMVDRMLGEAYRQGFKQGAKAAASLASEYRYTHLYRIDDCILYKLNLSDRKPRKNPKQIQEVK